MNIEYPKTIEYSSFQLKNEYNQDIDSEFSFSSPKENNNKKNTKKHMKYFLAIPAILITSIALNKNLTIDNVLEEEIAIESIEESITTNNYIPICYIDVSEETILLCNQIYDLVQNGEYEDVFAICREHAKCFDDIAKFGSEDNYSTNSGLICFDGEKFFSSVYLQEGIKFDGLIFIPTFYESIEEYKDKTFYIEFFAGEFGYNYVRGNIKHFCYYINHVAGSGGNYFDSYICKAVDIYDFRPQSTLRYENKMFSHDVATEEKDPSIEHYPYIFEAIVDDDYYITEVINSEGMDYRLISNLTTRARIFICLKAFLYENTVGHNPNYIREEVVSGGY